MREFLIKSGLKKFNRSMSNIKLGALKNNEPSWLAFIMFWLSSWTLAFCIGRYHRDRTYYRNLFSLYYYKFFNLSS